MGGIALAGIVILLSAWAVELVLFGIYWRGMWRSNSAPTR